MERGGGVYLGGFDLMEVVAVVLYSRGLDSVVWE